MIDLKTNVNEYLVGSLLPNMWRCFCRSLSSLFSFFQLAQERVVVKHCGNERTLFVVMSQWFSAPRMTGTTVLVGTTSQPYSWDRPPLSQLQGGKGGRKGYGRTTNGVSCEPKWHRRPPFQDIHTSMLAHSM